MPAKRRVPSDEYSIFETLRAKGVAVPPFATAVSEVGSVGIPAVLVARNAGGAHARTMLVHYEDIVPALAHALRTSPRFFMQRHSRGYEVACGVMMHGKKILSLVPVDAIPRALHESGAWHMKSAVVDAIQHVAKAAHMAMGAKTHSCVRLAVEGSTPYVTGVVIAPPLTRTGLFMRSAELAGLTEEEIKESII